MTCKYGGCFSHQRNTKFSIGAQLKFGFCEKNLNSLRFPLTKLSQLTKKNSQAICKTSFFGWHGPRTLRECFFKKSQTFGLEQTNRAEIFWGIWCIIGQTISDSLAHVFHYLTIISTKIFTSKSKIFVCDCDLVFGCPSSVDTIDQNINFAKLPSAKWLLF